MILILMIMLIVLKLNNNNADIYTTIDGSKQIPNFLINKQNLEANKNQLKDGLKIVGDFLNKSVLIPNNINFPMSRNEFIKLI